MWPVESLVLIPFRFGWPLAIQKSRHETVCFCHTAPEPGKPCTSLNTIRCAIRETLDIEPSDDPDLFMVGVIIASALEVGPNGDRLAKFTGYNRDKVREVAKRMRDNKLWVGHAIDVEHWFHKETGIISFVLDCLIGQGEIERVDDKFQIKKKRRKKRKVRKDTTLASSPGL